MAVTYAYLQGRITPPGTDIGVRGRLVGTPLSTGHALVITGDSRITLGPVEARTDGSGNLPSSGASAFRVPLGTVPAPADLLWQLIFYPESKTLKPWTVAVCHITATVNLTDVVEVDLLAVDPVLATTVAENAAAAAASRTAAAASETAAHGWADAALSSAADADTSADAAGVSEDNAAGSATIATTKAGQAATSETNAAGSATAAQTARTGAETARTGAETAKTGAETARDAAATSATNAATAKTAAETARDQAQAVGNTNDTIMKGVDANPASQFRVQQDARLNASLGPGGTEGNIGTPQGDARYARQGSQGRTDLSLGSIATHPVTDFVADGTAFADLGRQTGVDPSGAAECATALQTALNGFAALGVRAYAKGTFKVGSTVTIASNADLSDATFNYTGTNSTAVLVGSATSGTSVAGINVRLPRVIATAKTVTGWAQVAGTIGVDISNLYSSFVHLPYVHNFETGLRNYGKGTGNVHNTVIVGHLDNNKVNQLLDASTTGWSNQNLYLGGRFSHESAEGTAVAGTRHVEMAVTTNAVNNNLWLNSSLEGNVPEFHAIVAGTINVFDNARWEATGGAKVKWASTAQGNEIRGGYQASSIVETWVTGAGKNRIRTTDFDRFSGSGVAALTSGMLGGLILENVSSSSNPIWAIMEAGAQAAGTVTGTGYAWAASAQKIRGKRAADAFDRLWLDAVNGRLYIGAGTADPTMFIGRSGSAISFNNAHVDFLTDNTYDLGETGAKPRYIRAGTGLQTGSVATGSRAAAATAGAGAVQHDSTLNKLIWSNASAWSEAAAVLYATATLDFPSIAAAGSQELTIIVTGAAVGDTVALGAPAAIEAGLVWNGYVSATNTVKIRVSNITAAAIDPASATWKATVTR